MHEEGKKIYHETLVLSTDWQNGSLQLYPI